MAGTPSDESYYLATKLSNGFEELKSLPDDQIRYALANLEGRLEYLIKYSGAKSFTVDELADKMKAAAESQTRLINDQRR